MKLAIATAALAFALPAAAQTQPPEPNLVVIAVSRVIVPEHLPGTCKVTGVVGRVVRGKAYQAGQRLTLDVPCGVKPVLDGRPARPEFSAQPLDAQVLKTSKKGAALLTDDGHLIWTPPRDAPPGALRFRDEHLLGVVGYRVLDGAKLPVSPPRRTL